MSAPIAGLHIRHDLKPSAPPAEVRAIVDSAAERPTADLWIWAARYKVGDIIPYATWSTCQRWDP